MYFFICIISLYLELKEEEPIPSTEVPEVTVIKEEELQLLETPQVEAHDEIDQSKEKKEENTKEKAESKARCSKDLFTCPSWGNCVGPDNLE